MPPDFSLDGPYCFKNMSLMYRDTAELELRKTCMILLGYKIKEQKMNIKVKMMVPRKVGMYSMWEGITEDDKIICVFLANNVLHVSIFKNAEDQGITFRKTVDCPGQQMLMDEMLKQLGITILKEETEK